MTATKKAKSPIECRAVVWRKRPGWLLANEKIALCCLRGGGHLAVSLAFEQDPRQTLIFYGSHRGKRSSPSAIPNKNMADDLACHRRASTSPATLAIRSVWTTSARHLRKRRCWGFRSTAKLPPAAGRW